MLLVIKQPEPTIKRETHDLFIVLTSVCDFRGKWMNRTNDGAPRSAATVDVTAHKLNCFHSFLLFILVDSE